MKRLAVAVLAGALGLLGAPFTVGIVAAETPPLCGPPGEEVPATIVGAGYITGTSGNDVIVGSPGRDVILGLAGDDIICGNGGNDVILGGRGNDVIIGGPETTT